ncbi:MAG: glycosyltransferase [Candidatus Anstonellales archaeon]
MTNPYISVVVMAYNRKKFIRKALLSVLAQTISKSIYEIIVIKGFKDKKIDNFIKKNQIKSIYNPDKREGARLANAYKYIRGEIIAFLDDDDEFVSNKLDVVYKYFKENSDIVFYHNLYCKINADDAIIDEHTLEGSEPKSLLINNEDKIKYINIARRDFLVQENASSMVIRKKLLEHNLQKLKKIGISLDAFVFLISLLDTGKILVDNEVLTRYRVHIQGQVTNGPISSVRKFWLHRSKYTREAYNEALVLYNMAKNTKFENMARVNLSETKLYCSIYNGGYLPSIYDYFSFLIARHSKGSLSLTLQSIAAQLFRTRVIKLIYKHYFGERMQANPNP